MSTLPLPEFPEEIQRTEAQLWDPTFEDRIRVDARAAFAADSVPVAIVAEGDSWFDYAPGLDILDHLKHDYGYRIIKHAAAGDTIVDMAWGTGIRRNFSERPPQLPSTLASIRDSSPPS